MTRQHCCETLVKRKRWSTCTPVSAKRLEQARLLPSMRVRLAFLMPWSCHRLLQTVENVTGAAMLEVENENVMIAIGQVANGMKLPDSVSGYGGYRHQIPSTVPGILQESQIFESTKSTSGKQNQRCCTLVQQLRGGQSMLPRPRCRRHRHQNLLSPVREIAEQRRYRSAVPTAPPSRACCFRPQNKEMGQYRHVHGKGVWRALIRNEVARQEWRKTKR